MVDIESNSCLHFIYTYIDIAFSKLDIATQIYEMVY